MQLLLRPLELGELLGRGLALELARRPKLLDARLHLPDRAIGGQQLVEQVRGALARERGAQLVGLLTCSPKVDHRAKNASSTCATPSSSTDGQTKSASSRTRSCAFATATP